MIRIGLLSDTHSYLDAKVFNYFSECDEIWHAGDIGSPQVLNELKQFKLTRAVFGNIDGAEIRYSCSEILVFELEMLKIMLVHIAGPFKKYLPNIKRELEMHKPDILVCGHSHILKIAHDAANNLLYINPGACGKSGFHKVRTILRFQIDQRELKEMQVIELHES